jgi:uncharacterized protein RhaS with RHS repeats
MQARWYDPGTGQFLSLDPLESETGAAYYYAGDNPTDETDPTGEDAIPVPVELCVDGPEAAVACAILAAAGLFVGEQAVHNVIDALFGSGTPSMSVSSPNIGANGPTGIMVAAAEEPNPSDLERISDAELKRILKGYDTDPHTDKEETVGAGAAGEYDYYKDKATGDLWLRPRGGGELIPTGLNAR